MCVLWEVTGEENQLLWMCNVKMYIHVSIQSTKKSELFKFINDRHKYFYYACLIAFCILISLCMIVRLVYYSSQRGVLFRRSCSLLKSCVGEKVAICAAMRHCISCAGFFTCMWVLLFEPTQIVILTVFLFLQVTESHISGPHYWLVDWKLKQNNCWGRFSASRLNLFFFKLDFYN